MARARETREWLSSFVVGGVLVSAAYFVKTHANAIASFIDIDWPQYLLATALGLTPPAFLLAYLGKLPNAYEIIAFGVGGAIVVASVLLSRRRQRSLRR